LLRKLLSKPLCHYSYFDLFLYFLATIEHELSLRHKLDLERIETEVKAKTKSARENRDVNLEMMRASEEERRKTIMEQIRTAGGVLGAGFQEFIGDRTKIATTVYFLIKKI